jgi:serine/threonine protein phosphatase 1
MKQRIAVFGDVHGEIAPLRRAIAFAQQRAELVVGLGDYVNRGSTTSDVLDLMVDLSTGASSRYIFLKGNHEVELLRFLETGDLPRFSAFGGLQTIGSYVDPAKGNVVDEFQRAFPESHRELLRNMPTHLETEDYLFSHVGFDPADPMCRDERSMVIGSFHGLFTLGGGWPRDLVVSGHYPQRGALAFQSPHFISIDTGCGTIPGGMLTLLLLPSRKIAQFGVNDE